MYRCKPKTILLVIYLVIPSIPIKFTIIQPHVVFNKILTTFQWNSPWNSPGNYHHVRLCSYSILFHHFYTYSTSLKWPSSPSNSQIHPEKSTQIHPSSICCGWMLRQLLRRTLSAGGDLAKTELKAAYRAQNGLTGCTGPLMCASERSFSATKKHGFPGILWWFKGIYLGILL